MAAKHCTSMHVCVRLFASVPALQQQLLDNCMIWMVHLDLQIHTSWRPAAHARMRLGLLLCMISFASQAWLHWSPKTTHNMTTRHKSQVTRTSHCQRPGGQAAVVAAAPCPRGVTCLPHQAVCCCPTAAAALTALLAKHLCHPLAGAEAVSTSTHVPHHVQPSSPWMKDRTHMLLLQGIAKQHQTRR